MASVRIGLGITRGSWRSSCLPCGVSTDSGWNWTPSTGSSRWRSAHDHVARAGGHLELVRQLGVDDERVVAADHERGFEAVEDRPAVVLGLGGLAVHRLAAHHRAAVTPRPAPGGRGTRPAPARRLAVAADRLLREPGLLGRARARARRSRGRGSRSSSSSAGRCAPRPPRPQLAQVLDQVVGERVVVVDDEHARHAQSPCAQASRIASITAPALASVSRTS